MGNLFSRASNIEDLTHIISVDPEDFLSNDQTETKPLRNAEFPQGIIDCLVDGEPLSTAYEVFQRGCRISRTRPFLGQRRRQADDSEELMDRYQWWTYAEVEVMSRALGTGILALDLVKPTYTPEETYEPARELFLLGIGSRNRVEWFVTEQAANAYSFTLVPLYETLGDWAVYYMISDTKLTCLCGGAQNLMQYLRIIKEFRNPQRIQDDQTQPNKLPDLARDRVTSFICFDPISSQLQADAKELDIKIYGWMEVLALGQQQPTQAPLRLPTPRTVSSICYSSGTTGVPKGVIVTHGGIASNICAAIRGPLSMASLTINHEDCYMSYLPLAHVFERLCIHIMMSVGGRLAIYSGDPRKLLVDIRLAKPTIFASVPRLYMRINDTINAGIADHSAVARYLFAQGMETKVEGLRRSGTTSHPIWDLLVFNKVKDLMGGKLRYMLVGGAALDKNIQERMAVLFCCPLMEGYGLTETLGTTFLRRADDSIYGHMGAPLPCNEMKLVSVPEMNYLVTQSPPTGEICVRGNTVTPGYFKNPQQYQENLTPDGWFRTGDIGVLLPQGNRLKIIDRRKNIFKLAQGEYIAPERLESQLCQAPLIGQIFIYGDSFRCSLVAVVCVDEDELLRRRESLKNSAKLFKSQPQAAPNGAAPDKVTYTINWAAVKNDPEIIQMITQQLHDNEVAFGVKGFEKVKTFVITEEAFSCDNGLLTPTFKLKRSIAAHTYRSDIEKMYKKIGEFYDAKQIVEGDAATEETEPTNATERARKNKV